MNANVLRRDKQRNERIRSGQVFNFQMDGREKMNMLLEQQSRKSQRT